MGIDFESDAFGELAHVMDADGLHLLAVPPTADATFGAAINGGIAVGYWATYRPGTQFHAVVWNIGRGTFNTLALPMGPRSAATDVNTLGHVCGWMGVSSTMANHGFLVADGTVIDLGVIPDGDTAFPTGINASDTVVGTGIRVIPDTRELISRAFIWSRGVMTIVEPPAGYTRSALTAVNDRGDMVGRFWNFPTGLPEAGFLLRDGRITMLTDVVPPGIPLTIKLPVAIDNAGRILAFGKLSPGAGGVAVLMTPIPPSPDLDSDGVVGGSDLAILLGAWNG